MAAESTTPHSTTPLPLTTAQARALLQTLLSTTSTPVTAPRSTSASINPQPASNKPAQQAPRQQQPHQTITIDASTRVIGHCNTIQLASPLPTAQAAQIEELVHGALFQAKAHPGLSITVQAGVNVMGSKNVIVLGVVGKHTAATVQEVGNEGKATTAAAAEVSKAPASARTKSSALLAGMGRKRRAESVPADLHRSTAKQVKIEEV